MSPSARDLRPDTGERGLASWSSDDVAVLLSAAWDGLLEVASAADLHADTRLPGRTAHDLLVHMGRWSDDRDDLAALEAEARTASVSSLDDAEARTVAKLAAHRDAPRAEVLDALRAARDHVLGFVGAPDASEVGRRLVQSMLGPLPLTGLLAAQTVDLAVHALDITAGTERRVPDELLHAGVGGITDVTGALAARAGIPTTFAVVTPQGRWATGSDDEGAWTTMRLDLDGRPAGPGWPALVGEAADVLDAVTGRALAVQLIATRRIRLQGVPGLLRLVPALQPVPGLPGGSALQACMRTLSQTGRLLGRVSSGATRGVASTLRRR
ncbi:MAG: maleylpyruvate isomerase N-terminal domain-containing protein [Actinomycetes bacterium]